MLSYSSGTARGSRARRVACGDSRCITAPPRPSVSLSLNGAAMPELFKGAINVDVRDSKPGWTS
jgi:hypothetical protein